MLSGTPTPASALVNTYIKLPTIYRVLERSPTTTSSGCQTPNDLSTHSMHSNSTPVLPFHAPAAFEKNQYAFNVTPSQQRLLQAASSYLPTPTNTPRPSVPSFNPQFFPPPNSQANRNLTSSMESSRAMFRGRSSYPQGWDSLASMPVQARAGLPETQQPTGYRSLSGVDTYASSAFPSPSQVRQSRQTLQGNEPLLAAISRGSMVGISMPGQPTPSQQAPASSAVQLPQLQRGSPPRSRKDLLTSLSTHSLLGSYVQRQNLTPTPLIGLNAPPRSHRHSLPSGIPQHSLYTFDPAHVELSASSLSLDSIHASFQTAPPQTASASLLMSPRRQLSTAQAPSEKLQLQDRRVASQETVQQNAVLVLDTQAEAPEAQTDQNPSMRSDVAEDGSAVRRQHHSPGRDTAQRVADEQERSIWLDSEDDDDDGLSHTGQDRGEVEDVRPFSTAQHGLFKILPEDNSPQQDKQTQQRVSRVFRYTDSTVTRVVGEDEGEVLELPETEHTHSLSESY